MRYEFGQRPSKVAFTERDHAIEAFLSDRAYEPLRIGIAVGRPGAVSESPGRLQSRGALHGGAPLSIPIADQQALAA